MLFKKVSQSISQENYKLAGELQTCRFVKFLFLLYMFALKYSVCYADMARLLQVLLTTEVLRESI